MMFIISAFQLRKQYQLNDEEPYEDLLAVSYTTPLSILVPAYNESVGIIGSVRSLLGIEYPEYEVIVVNDGSSDDTLEKLIEEFSLVKMNRVVRKQVETKEVKAVYRSKLYDYLYVVDKQNGGKSDALNAGINLSNYPYFCSDRWRFSVRKRCFFKSYEANY